MARVYTEEFNEKRPLQPIYSRDWLFYNRHKDGVPAPKELQLPAKLWLVCKGIKSFTADFYSDEPTEWIVSGRFLSFLQSRHLLEAQYEQSELTLVSTSGKPIADQPYFLLRLFGNANDLIDIDRSPRVPSRHKPLAKTAPRREYYTEFIFRKGTTPPPFFFLDDRNYWYSFICNEEIEQAIKAEKFAGFDFYTLPEFIQEMEHRLEEPAPAIYKGVLNKG